MDNDQANGCGCLFIIGIALMSLMSDSLGSGGTILFLLIIGILFFIYAYVSGNEAEKKELTRQNEIRAKNKERADMFKLTKKISDLSIDDENKLFKFKNAPEIFTYDELEEVRLYQDNVTIHSGTSGAAVNFGSLSVGRTEESTLSEQIEQIDIVYMVNGRNAGRYTINLLTNPVQRNSEEYRLAIEKAERTVNALEKIKSDGSSIS